MALQQCDQEAHQPSQLRNAPPPLADLAEEVSLNPKGLPLEKTEFLAGDPNQFVRQETWKPISGFEGIYEISCFGRVYRCLRSSGTKGTGIIKYIIKKNGYAFVLLRKPGTYKALHVHRLVAKAFVPNPNNLGIVNHIDGNKLNNNADNLEWTTQKENVNHSMRVLWSQRALGTRGKKNIIDRAKKILEMRCNGVKLKDIAKSFGLCRSTVERFMLGTSSRYVMEYVLKEGARYPNFRPRVHSEPHH